MQLPLLTIKNLSINFSSINGTINHAVNNINFTLHTNEILAIVGESGSGKSVTALSILQLLPKKIISYPNGEINFYLNNEKQNILQLSNTQLQQNKRQSYRNDFSRTHEFFKPCNYLW
jgi:peptide/nickel transport system ATP-binding protein